MKDILQEKMQELLETVRNSPKELIDREFECPNCRDRGLIYEQGEARVCSCVWKKRLERRFSHARVAKEYRSKTFHDFDLDFYSNSQIEDTAFTYRQRANNCLIAAKDFTQKVLSGENGKGLYISGPVGSGKTLLVSCIANELLSNDSEVLFLSVPDFLDELRDTFNQKNLNEMDLMDQVRNVSVLILDDLGAHTYTEWTKGRIFNIINYRASNNLATVITSNLSVSEVSDEIDERTSSRILQLCQIYQLDTQEDIRRQVYKKKRI